MAHQQPTQKKHFSLKEFIIWLSIILFFAPLTYCLFILLIHKINN